MKCTTFRGLFSLALACIGLAVLLPSPAHAQTDDFSDAEAFFGLEHTIPGLPLTREELRRLRDGDPVIHTSFRTDDLEEEAAEHGWGSDRVRRLIDGKLSKEGNMFSITTLMSGVAVRIIRTKGVDVDQNCTFAEGFIVTSRSNGIPVFSHRTCNGNWQNIWSMAAASAIGQTATNVATIGASRGIDELFGPNCRNGCVPQQVFNLQGGMAVSASEANAAVAANLANQLTNGGGCATGGCPTPSSNPYPAGSAPAAGMTNPSGDGTH